MQPDDPYLSYLDLEKVTKPRSGNVRVYADYWWVCHPERGPIMYRGRSPQCNADKNVTDHIAAKLYPWAEVRQIPIVFLDSDI